MSNNLNLSSTKDKKVKKPILSIERRYANGKNFNDILTSYIKNKLDKYMQERV